MFRIALPNKGRLAEDARELFNDAGLEVRVRGDRALTASLGDDFEAVFVRAGDIPEFVADGAADAGGISSIDSLPSGARVATSFPRITADYFASNRRKVEIVPVSGAAEIA